MGDFDELWDYSDPAGSEQRFRDHLAQEALTGEQALALRTQIARAQGLQRDFDGAHDTLDAVEGELDATHDLARTRYLLERGRAVRSSGDSGASVTWFEQALARAVACGLDGLAVDAAHMLAIADSAQALRWTREGIRMAEASTNERARAWLGPLYNNGGWTHFERGELDDALDLFRRGEAFHRPKGNTRGWRIAQWTVGRTLRAQGRLQEALEHQRDLLKHWEAVDQPGGYVHEELGECLLALGRPDEARPQFAEAWRILSKDRWLPTDEPDRLSRMAALGGLAGP